MSGGLARYPSLSGKVAVVTGGATGIGKAIVEALAGQGARVTFLDRDAAAGAALMAALGDVARFVACDVTDMAALRTAIASAGDADILVANAADDTRHDAETLTPEAWDSCLAVNLKHQFFAAQAVQPAMARRGGGAIILLGSISWLNGTTGMVAYTTAKAGIHGLTRTLARRWGKDRIRVNALLPGWTMTERQLQLWVDPAAEREIDASQCLPGRVMPQDIAAMALYLAADDSRMVTQQAFVVDGGWI